MDGSVKLRVYDISHGSAKKMSEALFGVKIDGIWHTAIEAFGKEHYFLGGIRAAPPGTTEFGLPTSILDYGSTSVSEDLLAQYLADIGHRFTEETYNIFENNCNHFSNELLLFLTSREVPEHIMSLPLIISSTPMGSILSSFYK